MRAAEKEKADHMKPQVILQFRGTEISIDALVDAAKDDFRAVKKRTPVTDLKLYVKPEEQTAYYIVNQKYTGKVSF